MNSETVYPVNAALDSPSLAKVRQIFSRRINVLCIEDQEDICELFSESIFPSSLLNIKQVHTPEMAKTALSGNTTFHSWILDLTLQKHNDGMDLLKLKPNFPFCVVVSGAQSMDDATAAIKAGVYSAHDKKSIFTTNPHPFIAEVCALSAASFLLKGRRPARFDMYQLLLRGFVQTPEEWSANYCLNERTLRMICEDDSNLSPKQFLYLYHVLNFILVSDCLVRSMDGYEKTRGTLLNRLEFYNQCAEYVIRNHETVYGPHYLKM
jgi:Response regulator receiver domain.